MKHFKSFNKHNILKENQQHNNNLINQIKDLVFGTSTNNAFQTNNPFVPGSSPCGPTI